MRRGAIWDVWLLVAALAMMGFGVFMALGNRSDAFAGFEAQVQPVFFGATPPAESALRFQGWVYGVWGATVAGFGALAALVVRGPFRARQRWARDALIVSVLLWFVLDTAISIAYGVWFNAVFNGLVMAALVVPIGATWRQFPAAAPGSPRHD